jgi:Domain of unknown function (DUF4357)
MNDPSDIRPPVQRGTSIRIFLVDGTPDGLRIVEKSNWTGRALMTSRAQYVDVRQREEFGRPGVYLLRGPADGQGFDSRIYIGEADVPRVRIDSHAKNKDFWTSLILFTSKDDNLNKAHIRYLESRLVTLAQDAKRAELDNGNAPQLPALSEADRADADSFLVDMLLLYPVLAVSAFELVTQRPAKEPLLRLLGRDTDAAGRETPEGFVVYKGAKARLEAVPSTQGFVCELRKKLNEQGVLIEGQGHLTLNQDYLFNSPSTAASVLLGRSANGRLEWKDEKDRSLRDIQEAVLAGDTGQNRLVADEE